MKCDHCVREWMGRK